jgi:hypothetical protein
MALDGLSFERAEYGAENVLQTFCTWCRRGVADEVYRANEEPICGVCAERARNVLPRDTRAVYWRTTGVGAATAIGASMAYLQLMRVLERFGDGYAMGFGAIAVGYAIGYAMRTASKGAGGRRYQVTAALLVYAAVVAPLAVELLGVDGVPVWAYPFLLLTPFANMVFGHFQLGMLELFVMGIGVQWAWQMLKAPGLKITGPEKS